MFKIIKLLNNIKIKKILINNQKQNYLPKNNK